MLKMLEQIGDVEALQECNCKLAYFQERHLLLGISIQYKRSHWLLAFTGAFYFQGPVFWTGANFVDAPDDVSFDVWKRVQPDMSDERIQQIPMIFRVCMVQTATKPILIAYGGVGLRDNFL